MAATRLGIPLPAHRDAPRASGRYAVKAPDAPLGSVLRVKTRESCTKFVEVVAPHELRLFVDLDGESVDFVDWDYATRAEIEVFRFEWRIVQYTDAVEIHGALTLEATVRGLPDRTEILNAVACELKTRGKKGKAEQVLLLMVLGDE